ncbi:MAG: YncE family protein [Treponema sp.]|nr:YncE family protein [Treponema sp.]
MKKIIFLFLSSLIVSLSFAQNLPNTTDESFSNAPIIEKIGIYKCGKQPKQVLFSPDNKYVLLPLLDDNGFDLFNLQDKKIEKRIIPSEGAKKGFAEGLFIPEKNVFLVSQMTTAKVFEYSYPDFTYKRTFDTEQQWSKFIAYCPEKNYLAVSNWITNNITLFNYEDGTILAQISTSAAPRGMVFTDNGNTLISLSFDDGVIEKIDISTKKIVDSIAIKKAAMRHIVVNSNQTQAFVSDMYHKSVYKIDLDSFKITETTKVFNNPNTIDLLDDKYLFVSCRGPNNPEDYTKRSPVNGKICIIDTDTMEIVSEIQGGNQPTGLDVSNDGKLLCFSDFQDAAIELYSIKSLSK